MVAVNYFFIFSCLANNTIHFQLRGTQGTEQVTVYLPDTIWSGALSKSSFKNFTITRQNLKTIHIFYDNDDWHEDVRFISQYDHVIWSDSLWNRWDCGRVLNSSVKENEHCQAVRNCYLSWNANYTVQFRKRVGELYRPYIISQVAFRSPFCLMMTELLF